MEKTITNCLEKHYCTRCKYFVESYHTRYYCGHKTNIEIIDTPSHPLTSYKISYEVKNKNNDCSDFTPGAIDKILYQILSFFIKK